MDQDVRKLWVVLRLVPGMDRHRYWRLIQHFGSPEQVLMASRRELKSVLAASEKLIDAIINHHQLNIEKEWHLIQEKRIKLITCQDSQYPENLLNASTPPSLLYLRGQILPQDRYAIAVVGSRLCTRYGKLACQEITKGLVNYGFTIISGLAYGIDAIAHQAALENGGRTISVLGHGLARPCYPAENRELMETIAHQGAVISEYPMETLPEGYNFPERNYTIAALSLGTLIVEASEKSGALITAKYSLEENRGVYAVPGDIFRSHSRGTNAMIKDGAKLVQSAEDIVEDLQFQVKGMLREDKTKKESLEPKMAALSEEEQGLLSLIRQEPLSFEDLMASYGVDSVGRLSTLLLRLEMKHLIKQTPGKIYMAL